MGMDNNNQFMVAAIASFPKTFGLRAWPGKAFCIDPHDSYMSDSTRYDRATDAYVAVPSVPTLYVHRVNEDGTTTAFSKGRPDELRAQIVEL